MDKGIYIDAGFSLVSVGFVSLDLQCDDKIEEVVVDGHVINLNGQAQQWQEVAHLQIPANFRVLAIKAVNIVSKEKWW